jgi:hypothetical protein
MDMMIVLFAEHGLKGKQSPSSKECIAILIAIQ